MLSAIESSTGVEITHHLVASGPVNSMEVEDIEHVVGVTQHLAGLDPQTSPAEGKLLQTHIEAPESPSNKETLFCILQLFALSTHCT